MENLEIFYLNTDASEVRNRYNEGFFTSQERDNNVNNNLALVPGWVGWGGGKKV